MWRRRNEKVVGSTCRHSSQGGGRNARAEDSQSKKLLAECSMREMLEVLGDAAVIGDDIAGI